MPTIGIYKLPDYDLAESVKRLNDAKSLMPKGQTTFKRSFFTECLGYKVPSSANHLISALKQFGFVDTGVEEVSLTSAGEHVLFGDEPEKEEAKIRAIQNLPLLKDIKSKYGSEPTESQIRAFLKENANVPLQGLQSATVQTAKFLNSHSRYMGRSEMRGSPSIENIRNDEIQGKSGITDAPPLSADWESISFKTIKVSWKSDEFNDAKTLEDALSKLLDLWFQLNKPDKDKESTQST